MNILAYTDSIFFSQIYIIVTSQPQLQLNFSWGDTKIGLQVLCSCTSSSHTNFQSKLINPSILLKSKCLVLMPKVKLEMNILAYTDSNFFSNSYYCHIPTSTPTQL